jgi:phosphatidylinositol glycan class V
VVGLWGSEEASVKPYIWTGILISNLFHLFSVLALYRLARACLGPQQNPRIPFIASALHILSPAGLFLSAPYAESLFSALHFNGMLAYVNARQTVGTWGMTHDLYMLSSGILFACATCVRSNGLLSGLIFLYDVACYLPRLLTFQLNVHQVRRLFVTCAAGGILAMGYIIPQIVAYEEYCQSGHDNRPWCHEMIPSIYSWVQKQYW